MLHRQGWTWPCWPLKQRENELLFLYKLPSYRDFVGATQSGLNKNRRKSIVSWGRRPYCQLCHLLPYTAVIAKGTARVGTVLACDHLPTERAQVEGPHQGTQSSRMPSYMAMPKYTAHRGPHTWFCKTLPLCDPMLPYKGFFHLSMMHYEVMLGMSYGYVEPCLILLGRLQC